MQQSAHHVSHRRLMAFVLPLALLGSLIPVASVSAAVGITGATGGSTISADTNSTTGSSAYTTLVGPSMQEGGAGDLAIGSFVLNRPAGFEFNPGSASASAGGVGCMGPMMIGPVVTTATTVTIPITAPSTTACTLSVSGLQVRPTVGTPLSSGNITNTGTIGPSPGSYGALTEIAGAPILTFTSGAIASTTGGATLAPNPTFHSADVAGNNRNGDSVTLGIKAGTGTPGATLTCQDNTKPTIGAGNVTFLNCKVDKVGIGYVLRATTGAAGVDTNAFNISVGAPNKLVFQTYPAPTTPTILTPQPSVAVTDAGGNVITTDNSTVVTISINANPGTFSCTGGQSKTVTAGIATFAGCTQTSTGNYALTAISSPALTPVTGPIFAVSSALATKLALCWGTTLICPSTPPSPNIGGTAFSIQPTIRVQDAAGNTVTSDNTTVVTLGIAAGTPTSGGPGTLSCTGGLSLKVTAGVATFGGCSINKAGVGYMLTATSAPALTPATSLAFSVVVGPASRLTFIVQPPATASSGTAFPGSIQVAITDAGGNVISTGITATIALSIGTNPGGGTLACTGGNTANTVSGVASFTGCALTGTGSGYTLVATATTTNPVTVLAPATSTTIDLTAIAAVIAITTNPPLNTATPPQAVIVWGDDVLLTTHFSGNGANRQFQLQVTKDQITWSTIATLTTNASGDASFSYGPSDNRYYRAVFAGAPDLGAGTSPTVRVVVRSVIYLRPTNGGATKTISAGTSITFTATGRPNRPELPQLQANFVVFKLNGSVWVQIQNTIVPVPRSTGAAVLRIAFPNKGSFYVRAQLVPTPVNANSGWTTPVERYNVK